jgi:hypothetical protein
MINKGNFEQEAEELGATFVRPPKNYGSPGWRARADFDTRDDAKAFTRLCIESDHVRVLSCWTYDNRSLIAFR